MAFDIKGKESKAVADEIKLELTGKASVTVTSKDVKDGGALERDITSSGTSTKSTCVLQQVCSPQQWQSRGH